MTFRETQWNGAPVRIARVSFTGDVSFELSIKRSAAPGLWSALADQIKRLEGTFVGIEALSILRAEKGYLMIGKDTDGETMPHDLGFGLPRQKKTAAFVGDRGLHTAKANEVARKQLVGLSVSPGAGALPMGAHVVEGGENRRSVGYVTSSYHSPTLGQPIALGLVDNGSNRMGETVDIWHLGETRQATISAPCFFDPMGERLHA